MSTPESTVSPETASCIPRRTDRIGEMNRWRGEALHHFSATEHAIHAALAERSVAIPSQTCQRIDRLLTVLAEDGRKDSVKLLKAFQKWQPFRNALAHGVGKVAKRGKNGWIFYLRCEPAGDIDPPGAIVVDDQSEQGELAKIKAISTQLTAALGATPPSPSAAIPSAGTPCIRSAAMPPSAPELPQRGRPVP